MGRADWDLKKVERLDYSLSEITPLRVRTKSYPRTSATLFDMHYALELGIVMKGCMGRLYQGFEAELVAGEVWFCGTWEPHGWSVVTAPCEAVVISLWPPMLANLVYPEAADFDWMAPFSSAPANRPRISGPLRKAMLDIGRDLASATLRESPKRELLSRTSLERLLLELPEPKKKVARERLPSNAYGRINAAVDLAFKSRRYLTTTDAAKACAMSRRSFNTFFERVMGISFSKFALRRRIDGAASRLLGSDDAIKAIAAEWGFTDSSHLHSCFVDVYGCSPAEYRKRKTTSSA
jgi:AraC-like DNA-binding protein